MGFQSTLSRRTISNFKNRHDKSLGYSKMNKKTNCRQCKCSKKEWRISMIILFAILWILFFIYLMWGNNIFTPSTSTLDNNKNQQFFEFYEKYIGDYNSRILDKKQVIYTNIGIVIPAYFNEFTIKYLNRILHNIYLSQIDFQPISMDNNSNNIYYPSELIISMSIMPNYYQYKQNLSETINYYQSKFLDTNNGELRLKMIYHDNVTMNAAENRNFGLSQINYSITDYVGFFDLDDIMHPQRMGILYYILNGNKNNIDFIFHSFLMNKKCKNKNIDLDYLEDFRKFDSNFMTDSELQSLSQSISDDTLYVH